MRDAEKSRDHLDTFMKGNVPRYRQLRHAIQAHDGEGDKKMKFTHRMRHWALVVRLLLRVLRFDLFQHRTAAFAHGWICRVFTNTSRVIPAALAFLSGSFADLDLNAAGPIPGPLRQRHRRDDE